MLQWQRKRAGNLDQESAAAQDSSNSSLTKDGARKVTKPMTLIVFGKVHNLSENSEEIFDVDFGRFSMMQERRRKADESNFDNSRRSRGTLATSSAESTHSDLALTMEGRKHLANEEAKARFSPSSYTSDVKLANHIQTINVRALERAAAAAKARGGGIVDRRATRLRSLVVDPLAAGAREGRSPERSGDEATADDDTNVDAAAFHLLLEPNAVVCAVEAEEMARGFKRIVDKERLRSNSLRRFRSSVSMAQESDFLSSAGERSLLDDLHRDQRSVFDIPELTTKFREMNVDDIIKYKRRMKHSANSRPPTAEDPEFERMTVSSRINHNRRKSSNGRDPGQGPHKSGAVSVGNTSNGVVDDPFDKFGDVLFGEQSVSSVFPPIEGEGMDDEDDDAAFRLHKYGGDGTVAIVPPRDDEACTAVTELVDYLFPQPNKITQANMTNRTQNVLFLGKTSNALSKPGVAEKSELVAGGDVRNSFMTLKRHESLNLLQPSAGGLHHRESFLMSTIEAESGVTRRCSTAQEMQSSALITRRDTMRSLFDALHTDAQVKTQEFETKVEARPDGSLVQRVEASQITPGMSAALRYRQNRKSPTSSLWLNMTKACNTTLKKIHVATKVHEATAVRDAMLLQENKRKQAAAAQQVETVLHRYQLERSQHEAVMADPLKRTDLVNKWIEEAPPRQKVDRYRHAHFFVGSALSEEAKQTAACVQEGFRRVEAALAKPKRSH